MSGGPNPGMDLEERSRMASAGVVWAAVVVVVEAAALATLDLSRREGVTAVAKMKFLLR